MLMRHGLTKDEAGERERTGAGRMSEPIIRIEGLRKAYAGGVEALKGVDLDIRQRRDTRAARAQWRGQDDADLDRLRDRHADAAARSPSAGMTIRPIIAPRAR